MNATHQSQCELRTPRAKEKVVALQAERLEPDGSASVTAALHENSFDVYWEIMRTLFNFFKKKGKTEIKQNIKPPCPTRPTFV